MNGGQSRADLLIILLFDTFRCDFIVVKKITAKKKNEICIETFLFSALFTRIFDLQMKKINMRVECNIFVGMRRNSGDCKLGRPSRCFLGLKNSQSLHDNRTPTFQLLVQYQSKKSGKFKINKDSVQSVINGQARKGKATILLNQPPANIYISEANPSKLAVFLRSLQQILDNNFLNEKDQLQTWEANCSKSDIATANIRRLHITQRSDYPKASGFPPALRELRVNVGLKSIDIRWFALGQLTVLDLSVNRLGMMRDLIEWRKLESIRRLNCLKELNLSENFLSILPREFFDALPVTLTILNLSKNGLCELPNQICRLRNLQKLHLNYNELIELPEDLCLLKNLHTLLVSDNYLSALPATIFSQQNFRRFQHLDLSNNRNLTSALRSRRLLQFMEVPELIKIAAAAFLNLNIVLEAEFLPRDVDIEMRGWLRRCYTCLRLFPRVDSIDMSDVVGVAMPQFAFDMYSGPAYLYIERFFCSKCNK